MSCAKLAAPRNNWLSRTDRCEGTEKLPRDAPGWGLVLLWWSRCSAWELLGTRCTGRSLGGAEIGSRNSGASTPRAGPSPALSVHTASDRMGNTGYRWHPKPPWGFRGTAPVAWIQNQGTSLNLWIGECYLGGSGAPCGESILFLSCTNVAQGPYFVTVLMYREDKWQPHTFLALLLFYITQVCCCCCFLKKLSGS